MLKQKRLNKHPFLMLEVLIAFALITLCAVPLIYPHFAMIKAQKEFINKMKINHSVNLIYVNILEKLHKNEIRLGDIEQNKTFDIHAEELKEINGYKASYQFVKEKHKVRDINGFTVYLLNLQLKFIPKMSGKTLVYDYNVFLGSKKEPNSIQLNDNELDDEEYET